MNLYGIEIPNSNYINGNWSESEGESFIVADKFTNESLAEIQTWEDTEAVINSALDCKKEIDKLNAGEKRKLLEDFLTAFKNYEEELVKLVVAEAGKPINYARVEVTRCQTTILDSIEECTRISGEVVPMDFSIGAGKTAFTKLKGAGVVLAISPFNFPLNLALHKIAPAVAAGCPVILRPSPHTPICALVLAKIAEQANWPKGLLQVVNTPIKQTQMLVEDTRIRTLSFTGSDTVGWMLRDKAHQKNVVLELGGNAAVYIDKDTDVSKLGKKLCDAAFLYAGQICISTQRIYVHESLFEAVKSEMLNYVSQIKTGTPSDKENLYGPVIDCISLQRIDSWVCEDIEHGAEVLSGAKILDEQAKIYAPTILTNTNEKMNVHKKEFFAPVVSLESVSDADQAFGLMNNTDYGLQAGVYSSNIHVINEAFNTLDVGAVIINNVPGYRVDSMPYGGMKCSGLGREGARYSIEAYSEKTLCIM